MTDHADLIAKLSEAKVGSDELSALVFCALNDGYRPGEGIQLGAVIKPGRGASGGSMRTPEPVTTSVDAALALIEKRLPGWSPSIVKVLHEPVWMGEVVSPDLDEDDISEVGADGSAATPALALCIAILNALQDQQIDAALKPEGGET